MFPCPDPRKINEFQRWVVVMVSNGFTEINYVDASAATWLRCVVRELQKNTGAAVVAPVRTDVRGPFDGCWAWPEDDLTDEVDVAWLLIVNMVWGWIWDEDDGVDEFKGKLVVIPAAGLCYSGGDDRYEPGFIRNPSIRSRLWSTSRWLKFRTGPSPHKHWISHEAPA